MNRKRARALSLVAIAFLTAVACAGKALAGQCSGGLPSTDFTVANSTATLGATKRLTVDGSSVSLAPTLSSTANPAPTTPPNPPTMDNYDTRIVSVTQPTTSNLGGQVAPNSPGHTCVTIHWGNLKPATAEIAVVPPPYVITVGGGFDLFSPQTATYSVQSSSPTISPTPMPTTPPPATVNRIQQTEIDNTPGIALGMAHIRLTESADGLNFWAALGVAQNSQGPVYGFSISPPRNDLLFLTVGVQQLVTQQLLPGYSVNQIVPQGVTVTSSVKTPRVFVGLTANATALGNLFGSKPSSSGQ